MGKPKIYKSIYLRSETYARLMKIKNQEGRKSIDVVLTRLLDAAEEAKRQGIDLVEETGDETTD